MVGAGTAAALPARLLKASPGMRVVDLCAAPGGKSAEIALTGANVTAVDRSAERLKRLAVNFERLRLNAEIAVADALSFDAPPFDAVLLDAPCSATGTIRRHPDVAWTKRAWRSGPALPRCQVQLLDKAVALTKPGGGSSTARARWSRRRANCKLPRCCAGIPMCGGCRSKLTRSAA